MGSNVKNNDQVEDDLKEDLTLSDYKDNEKVHPWRLCPIGKHYVRSHSEHISPSKKHPEGEIITRHAHCANNPPHKNKRGQEEPQDILSFDELQTIATANFSNLIGPPKAKVLKFHRADEFDPQIRGWVCYWNKVFDAKDPLDPNLVKALIASESSFRPELKIPTADVKMIGYAHGLMQLTDDTLGKISGHRVELRNHFINLTPAEALDPSANICAGVRWLFMKYAGARERFSKAKLDRPATWDDAVAEYKGILKAIIENKDPNHNPDRLNEMPKFRHFYKQLLES